MGVPETHPRKESLRIRHLLIGGFRRGLVAEAGLIAHGRGEAYDYLIGEKTHSAAEAAMKAAAALLQSTDSAISVNGNTAALCPKEIVSLAEATDSRLEVNLFYRSDEREKLIRDELLSAGARKVYGVGVDEKTVPGLDSERAKTDEAILDADTVLVMLEDGDRTEKLVEMGKKVIAIDLNPMSRTAQKAHISVVDNVVRALPKLTEYARAKVESKDYDNTRVLADMEKIIRGGL